MEEIKNFLVGNPEIAFALAVLPPIFMYAYGAYLGAKSRIVVYRNYYDVMIVGLLIIIPSAMVSLLLFFYDGHAEIAKFLAPTFIAMQSAVLLVVIFRTWRDNGNILKTLLALYVKLPTAIIFFLQLMLAFNGDTRRERRESVMWTILLVPLLYALVHDKKTGRLPGMPRRQGY